MHVRTVDRLSNAVAPSVSVTADGAIRGRFRSLWRLYRLEAMSSTVVLIICAALFSVVFGRVHPTSARPQGLQPGAKAESLQNYDWSVHPGTILLAIKVGCQFCENNLPFYQRLITDQKSGRLRPHLLILFPDTPAQISRSYGDLFSSADHRTSVDFVRHTINVTPTLALVDRHGILRQIWFGSLAPDQQTAFLQQVEPQQDCAGDATCKN